MRAWSLPRAIATGTLSSESESELEIAQAAVDFAMETKDESGPLRHVGYYLIDAGLANLEAKFRYQPRPSERLRRFLLRHATGTYLGTLTFLTLLIVSLLLYTMRARGASWPILALAALLALIPASDLALTVLNWDLTHFFPPRLLPRMETSTG